MKEEKYKSKIHERYAKEQAAKRAQYKEIAVTVSILANATIFAVIFVTIFAIAFFPQDISVIVLITIIYSGAIFVGIFFYYNKKTRELSKH